jgi:hypothetical protein
MKLHCLLVFVALRALETSHAFQLSPKSLSITCRPIGDISFSRLQAEERWLSLRFFGFTSATSFVKQCLSNVKTIIVASPYSGKSRKRRIKGSKKGTESSESNVSVKNKKIEVSNCQCEKNFCSL